MAIKVKNPNRLKLVVGLLFIGAVVLGKVFWYDKLPQDVVEAKTFGKVVIPDLPEASLEGKAAVKLPLPSKVPANLSSSDYIASVRWLIMPWQSQNGVGLMVGGTQTTKGSLAEQAKLDITLERKDDCADACKQLVKFTQDYHDDPKNTQGVFITFMGSGIPAYISGISKAVEALGPEYQPVAFLTTGKSYGEDQIIGDIKYKRNKQLLRGAVIIGYRMDGDLDLAFKLTGDSDIPVNVDDKTYDSNALNFMYCTDFLDAAKKYNEQFAETRKIVKDGKTTGRDTVVSAGLVATWTPGDVNVNQGRGGVTIISTLDYSSIMPNITITCKKWLNDHRTAAEEITRCAAIAGDQIRSFDEAKRYACALNVELYNEQDANYWYRYYNGVKIDEDTRLGGSMVFNLGDMANMLGIYVEGQTNHTDIYGAVYKTFGDLQSKYYPDDLPEVMPYNRAFDKSVLMSVVSAHPELLEGKVNTTDYAHTDMTNQIGQASYHIEFATGSAEITPAFEEILDKMYLSIVTGDGTMIYEKKELLLSVKGASLTYDTKPILRDVNMEIHNITRPGVVQGQIVAICGRSGCGKTSLFKLLSGYEKPTTGHISVGEDQHDVRTGEMGMVPQNYPLFGHRTVYDNLALALTSQTGKEKKDTITSYAEHFELDEQLEKYPCDLSGGQRQRASILQQVLAGNKFILMDEPFSGLDILMKDRVIDLMVKVSNLDEMNTLVVVSHDYESSCAIADTVFILANSDGTGSTVVKTYDFLGEGLAYSPDIKENKRFREIMKEIKTIM